MGLLLGPLSPTEFENISKREQWSKHYDCITITVETVGGTRQNVKCVTSIAKKTFVRRSNISIAYKRIVEEGLSQLSNRFQMPDFLVIYRNNTYESNGELLQ
jgi:hypothetical protein